MNNRIHLVLLSFLLSGYFLATCTTKSDFKLFEVENYQDNVLRKLISFESEKECKCYIEYKFNDGDEWLYSEVSENRRNHEIRIINLLPSEEYSFRITCNVNGKPKESPIYSFQTEALPVDIPEYHIEKGDYTFNGYILLKKYRDNGCFVLLDDSARVVWYESYDTVVVRPFFWTADKHILSLQDSTTIHEFDLLGEKHHIVDIKKLGFNTRIHHELFKSDSNDYVFLKYDYKYLDLSDIGGKVKDTIRTDGIMVMDQEGKLEWEWSVFDVLNPLEDPDILNVKNDWGHANSISYTPDGHFLVSLRDFDQTWKINSVDGSVIWKFGRNGDFEMPDSLFTLRQHSAHINKYGDLMVFDNGSDTRGFSRVVSYQLDEIEKKAILKLNISLDKSMTTFRMGSAYMIEDDNILVCSPKKQQGLGIYDMKGNQVWKAIGNFDSYRAIYIPKADIETAKPKF